MKGQISLELMVTVLVMISVLSLLISIQNEQTRDLSGIAQDVKEKMQTDVIGTYCNLLYFNRYNIELGLALDMDNKKDEIECFGAPAMPYGNRLEIDKGIKRW